MGILEIRNLGPIKNAYLTAMLATYEKTGHIALLSPPVYNLSARGDAQQRLANNAGMLKITHGLCISY